MLQRNIRKEHQCLGQSLRNVLTQNRSEVQGHTSKVCRFFERHSTYQGSTQDCFMLWHAGVINLDRLGLRTPGDNKKGLLPCIHTAPFSVIQTESD